MLTKDDNHTEPQKTKGRGVRQGGRGEDWQGLNCRI